MESDNMNQIIYLVECWGAKFSGWKELAMIIDVILSYKTIFHNNQKKFFESQTGYKDCLLL